MGIVFRARNEHARQCVFMRSRDVVVVAVPARAMWVLTARLWLCWHVVLAGGRRRHGL